MEAAIRGEKVVSSWVPYAVKKNSLIVKSKFYLYQKTDSRKFFVLYSFFVQNANLRRQLEVELGCHQMTKSDDVLLIEEATCIKGSISHMTS